MRFMLVLHSIISNSEVSYYFKTVVFELLPTELCHFRGILPGVL